MKEKLDKLAENHDAVLTVRGKGLMLGVVFKDAIAKQVGNALRECGILVGVVGGNVLRIVPPLIVSEREIDAFVSALGRILTGEERG